MSTTGEELLRSFDLLPEPEKREVASEIIRRTFASVPELDDAQLAALYSEFAEDDRNLAEEGLEDYQRGLHIETSSDELNPVRTLDCSETERTQWLLPNKKLKRC